MTDVRSLLFSVAVGAVPQSNCRVPARELFLAAFDALVHLSLLFIYKNTMNCILTCKNEDTNSIYADVV